jgi:hypothetical protein
MADADLDIMMDAVATEFGRTVTLRRVTSHTKNTTTGAITRSNTDTTCTANRLPVTEDGKAVGGDSIEAESVRYSIPADQLSIVPGPDDLVIDGTRTMRVVSVTEEANGRAYMLACRQERSANG